MKRIYLIITIAILLVSTVGCSAQTYINTKAFVDEWEGRIRIEGNANTFWNGIVTVSDSTISAKNVSTGEMEDFYISFPSVLGAVDEASKLGGFSYLVEYWPDWDAFLIKTIKSDSDWWHYWVDYELPMVGVGQYELKEEDDEILVGYLENWEAHALKLNVDKTEVKKGEKFTVSVFNETNSRVGGATVFVGENNYKTNNNGTVTISLSKKGNFAVYSEKDDFVRSEKKNIQVKIKNKSHIMSSNSLIKLLNILFNQKLILKHLIGF